MRCYLRLTSLLANCDGLYALIKLSVFFTFSVRFVKEVWVLLIGLTLMLGVVFIYWSAWVVSI